MTPDELTTLVDDPAARDQVTAVELAEAALARIDASQPVLNAFISVDHDRVLADAREVDARRASGDDLPLAGWPIAVKDNIDVAGYVSTAGSRLFSGRPAATVDAPVVARLRAAGAVVVGKVTLHELAYGGTNDNAAFGACRNPWDTDRVPGGSSGGSGVAVAADLCFAALGTDTGGSVRIPASYNGVTALRPTFGTTSNTGVRHISASFDTVGVLARAASDVELLSGIIAGADPSDPWSLPPGHPWHRDRSVARAPLDGLRIGVLDDWFTADADPEVVAAVDRAVAVLETLGAVASPCSVPDAEVANEICTVLIRAEAYATHADALADRRDLIGADVVTRLLLAADLTGREVTAAYETARRWASSTHRLFDDFDLLVGPTVLGAPPRIDEVGDMVATTARGTRLTYPWSVAGVPAASVPCGIDSSGLPLGMQVIAAPGRDAQVLAVAQSFQALTDHHRRRPAPVAAR